MNGKRCAIFLVNDPVTADDIRSTYVSPHGGLTCHWPRIFGSHSEAKRELTKWLPAWPDAKIVDEAEL